MATPAEIQKQIDAAEARRQTLVTQRDEAAASIATTTHLRDQRQTQVDELRALIEQDEAKIAAFSDTVTTRTTEIGQVDAELVQLRKDLEDAVNAGKKAGQGIAMGAWSPPDDTARRKDLAAVKAVGFGGIRTGINGSSVLKAPDGPVNTNAVAAIGKACLDIGLHWNCCLSYFHPSMAVGGRSDKNPPRPEHYDQWDRYIRETVTAYYEANPTATPEDIAWEIWNEQDNKFFWEVPDPKVYVILLRRARRIIKRIRPDAIVVFGGLAPAKDAPPQINPVTFVKRCYEAGMTGDDYDEMNLHPYNGGQSIRLTAGKPWDLNTTQRQAIEAIMRAHGDGDKLMRSTEFGFSTRGDSDKAVSEAEQGALAVEQMEFLRTRPNAGWSFLFNWKELGREATLSNSLGIHRFDGTPKPAVAAIRKYLTGAAAPAGR